MMTAKRPPSDTPGAAPPSRVRPSIDPAHLFREALSSILKMARNRGFESDSEQRDIAQTVGEALVRHRGDYDPDLGTPIEWAMGIAKNVIREATRRRRTERRYIDAAPSEGMKDRPALDLTPEERARANDALSLIRATLTEEQLDIFELSAEHRTAEEVAGILGVTRSRVEQRIREARERLAALLKRLGEDKASASRVRGVMLPFVTAADLEAELRAGRVREGVAADLWRRVVERTDYSDGGGEDEPPEPPRGEAPTARAPRPRAPSPLDAGRTPQLPAAGQLAGPASRVMLSAGQLTAGAALVFVTGAVVGAGILAVVTSDEPSVPPSILAEPAPEVVLASASSPLVDAPPAVDTARTVGAPPAGTTRGAASMPTASTSIDPATADESTLLQMALTAPPRRALDLANQHAHRFPAKQVGKREVLIVRALVALGRRSEAEARARALKGTVYQQAVTDALGGAPL